MTAPAEVQETIGGRVLVFKWCFTAVVCLQEHWGLNTEKALEEKMGAISTRELPVVLWAMAQKRHPEIDQAMMLDLVDDTSLDELGALIGRVIKNALPPKMKPGANVAAKTPTTKTGQS